MADAQALLERSPDGDAGDPTRDPRHLRRRRLRRVVALVGAVVVTVGLGAGLLLDDAAQANHRFDHARRSLSATRVQETHAARALADARFDLRLLERQVGSDTTALAQDAAQLQGALTALTAAQAHVSQQASMAGSLHACLGGVEQALNALAVGAQPAAIAALHAVQSSCSTAVAPGG